MGGFKLVGYSLGGFDFVLHESKVLCRMVKLSSMRTFNRQTNLYFRRMKKFYALFICWFCFAQIGLAQTNFESESDVLAFLEGKIFYSTDQTVKVKIGYSSTLNTYGIILNGSTTYFNLEILILSPTKAIITGESLSNPDGKMKIRVNTTTDCLENEGSYYCIKK